MNMYTYPFEKQLAFFIDQKVAAFIVRKDLLDEIEANPDLAGTDITPDMLAEETASVCDAVDILQARDLDQDICYASEFAGTVTWLDKDGNQTVKTKDFEDDFIACIVPQRESTPFKCAYNSMDEFIDEIRKLFNREGIFPDNFDYAANVVSISGTYLG